MFSDIKELEQEITQFRKNLQENGKVCDSLKEIQVRLSEMARGLEHTSETLLSSLDTSREEYAAQCKTVSEALRGSAEQVGKELDEQSRTMQEQAQTLTDVQRDALEALQAKTAQALEKDTQAVIGEIKGMVEAAESTRTECAALQETLLAQFRGGMEQACSDMEEQGRIMQEQAQTQSDIQRAALEDFQAKMSQLFQKENRIYLDGIQQAVGNLMKDQTQKFETWESAAERLTALVEQNIRNQNAQVSMLLDKINAMDLSTVNERIANLRVLVFSALGVSACTLAAVILSMVLK